MIKKIIAAILSSSIALSIPMSTLNADSRVTLRANAAEEESNEEGESKEVSFGDLNGDGKINAIDASIVLSNYARYSTSDDTPSELELEISDINADNKVNAIDASYILSYYAYISIGGKLSFKDYLIDPNGEPSEVVTTTTEAVTTETTTTEATTTEATTTEDTETSTTTTGTDTTTTTAVVTTTTIPADLDTDEDGLTDVYENMLGTDVNKADTDGDGLTDYQEVYVTGTDPLVSDSVTKDVSDSDADLDNDGLSNAEEIKLGTEPKGSDSDNDGLNDGEEVNTYKTDPLKFDTDGDTISDGDEVKLGLDPCKASSDGTNSDKDRKFEQHIGKESEALSFINTADNPFKVSMDITASGYAETALSADESGYANVVSSDMVLGIVPEFEYAEGLSVDDVVLNFDIESDYIANTNGKYAAVSDSFEGIKRFNVFKYFEDTNMLLPIETTYDVENNRVTTHVDELGTYCLMDMEKWFENIDIKPEDFKDEESAAEQVDVKNFPGNTRKYAANKHDEIPIDVVFHVFAKENNLESVKSAIRDTAYKLFDEYGEDGHVRIFISAYTGKMIQTNYDDSCCAYNGQELELLLLHVPAAKATDINVVNSVKNVMDEYKEHTRTGTDGYYVFIENMVVDLDDNVSKKLKQRDQITSFLLENNMTAVALSNFPEDYQFLATNTDGTLIKKISNFGEQVSDYIIEKHSNGVRYTTVLPTGWKKVTLKKAITPEYKEYLDGIVPYEEYDYTDRSRFADTDEDGIPDVKEVLYKNIYNNDDLVTFDSDGEVILPTLADVMDLSTKEYKTYIKNALKQYEISWRKYKHVKLLPVKSDPTEKDGDFDGAYDIKDRTPLSNVIDAKLISEYGDKFYHGKISYSLDMRDFFLPSTFYNRKLSEWGALLSTVVYTSNDRRYISYEGEKMHADKLLELHGFEGIEIYDTREVLDREACEKYERDKSFDRKHYVDSHALRMFIGYKNLDYNGLKKTIIAVVLEGTETSIEEWTSNFDIGSTIEKEAVDKWLNSGETDDSDFDEPLKYWRDNNKKSELRAFAFWETPEHHKGFDITANRMKYFIEEYKKQYASEFVNEKPSFFVTGHSRAAAVANILSYYLINDNYQTYAYTFACPSTTTKNNANADKYDSIFNINNSDDFVPMIPMDTWHFKRYGKTAEIKGISDTYTYVNEWQKLMIEDFDEGCEYDEEYYENYVADDHNDLKRTIIALSFAPLSKGARDILTDYFEKIRQTNFDSNSTKKEYVLKIRDYLLNKIEDDNYFRNNCYKFNYRYDFDFRYDPEIGDYNFEDEMTKIYTKSMYDTIPKNARPFYVCEERTENLSVLGSDIENTVYNICQCPAYFMQFLAAYSCGDVDMLPYAFDYYDTAERYESAKHYLLSSGAPIIGGITYPHYLQSYIVLSKHIERDDFDKKADVWIVD